MIDFYSKYKEMMDALEKRSHIPNDGYHTARMAGRLEAELMSLPRTQEVFDWMDRVIERANDIDDVGSDRLGI